MAHTTTTMKIYPASILPLLFTMACVTPMYEPYIVPEPRQKENVYYIPSAHHAPLLSKKNDFRTTMMASFAGRQTMVEFQGAYLPAKHIGLTLNYSTLLDGQQVQKFNRLELGTGFFLPVSDLWLFETYGGWGKGSITNFHQSGFSDIDENHFFLQPAIAVSNRNRTLQFAFVSKLSRVTFSNIDTLFQTDREPFATAQLQELQRNEEHYFLEPGLIFRFGWNHFLFHSSFTVSKDLSFSKLNQVKSNFSLGLTFRFMSRSQSNSPAGAASLPHIE